MALEFERSELTADPQERQLNMSKTVVVFNIKLTDKSSNLNTGSKFNYQNETYEIMNREAFDSPYGYIKVNCVRKISTKASD